MAHNLMKMANGNYAAMYADKPAWHGLGVTVKGAQNWQETMKLAGLNWQVGKLPLFDQNGQRVSAWGVFKLDSAGNPTQFIAPVGDKYTTIQNEYAFNFVDTVLEAENGAHYDAAGALGNGEKIWCLARVPYDFQVNGGDAHQTYLLFTTSHDGSLAAQCKLTTVRVVCQNTLSQAVAMNGVFTKVKHTKEAERKLDAARKLIGNARLTVAGIQDKLNTLSRRILTKDTYMKALESIFPAPKGQEAGASTARRDNVLMEVTRLFESNDNNAFPDIRGTAYNLLNAVTEYTDHSRPTRVSDARKDNGGNQDISRRESAMWGSGETLKQNAVEIIMEATNGCQTKSHTVYAMPTNPEPRNVIDDILGMVN